MGAEKIPTYMGEESTGGAPATSEPSLRTPHIGRGGTRARRHQRRILKSILKADTVIALFKQF